MQQMRGKGGTVIGTITLCGMLGALAYKDWKEQKVSVYAVLVFIILGMIFHVVWQEQELWNILAGAGLGAGFLVLSWISHGSIGAGDGAVLVATGVFLGFWENLRLLFLALILSALVAGYLLVIKRKGRKDRMPFIPFLFLADLLLMIC